MAPRRYFRCTVLSLSRRLMNSRHAPKIPSAGINGRAARQTCCSILMPVGNAATQLTYTFLTNTAEDGIRTLGQQHQRVTEGLEGNQTIPSRLLHQRRDEPGSSAQHQELSAPRLANTNTAAGQSALLRLGGFSLHEYLKILLPG